MSDKEPEIVRIIKKGDYENSPTTTTVKSKMALRIASHKRKNSLRRSCSKLQRVIRREILNEQKKNIETNEVS